MTEVEKIMANLPDPAELARIKADKRRAHVEAVCSGLFACASDIAAMQKAKQIEEGPEILLEGAAAFVARLFDGVLQGIGETPAAARTTLDKAVREELFRSRREASGRTVQ